MIPVGGGVLDAPAATGTDSLKPEAKAQYVTARDVEDAVPYILVS